MNRGSSLEFLGGGGELGARMRAMDWSATSLGPAERWPQSLKTAVRILLTSRQPMWIGWGADLLFLYNDAYKSIIGGRHPWALGQPTRDVWHEIWLDIEPRLMRVLRDDEGTYDERLLLVMERNGYPEETYYTFSYSPIPDEDGRPGGVFCANTDDTERIIHERQLALLGAIAARGGQARNVREACEFCCEALATDPLDLPFALLYLVRPNGEATLGCAAGIEPGDACAPHVIGAESSRPWPVHEVAVTGEWQHVDIVASRTDGPRGPWATPPPEAVVAPIAFAGPQSERAVLVAALSPYRLFDPRYAEFLRLVLAQIGSCMAAAKAHADERRRAEALAEIDRAKTVFFGNVSHEFRTPLTLMLGPIENLLDTTATLAPADRDALALALRNGQRLAKLVDALLDFSRLEAGRVDAWFEPTDLSALTRDIAGVFREAMEHAGLDFRVDCEPLPEPVFVDRDMWEKIVLNLLSNAFKYTLQGKVRLSLAAEGPFAALRVEDTGVGIPPDALPRVFERFYRVLDAPARTHEGTGIGLALVEELGRLHGAEATAQSELGRGSVFTLRVPFGTAHLPADRLRAPRPPRHDVVRAAMFVDEAKRWDAAGTEGPGSGALTRPRSRVLVVEDNSDMRDYLVQLLAHAYDVATARDGGEALVAIRQRRPDLVLTDMLMPRVDGAAFVRALRADVTTADIPVIVLSARAGDDARIEGLAAGADDYVNKPFTARELLARVDAALALAGTRARTRESLADEAQFLETLNHVGRAVAGELDLKRVMQTVTDAATALTGAAAGALYCDLPEPGDRHAWFVTTSGPARACFTALAVPPSGRLFERTLRSREVVRCDDRCAELDDLVGAATNGEPLRSYLAVPIVSRNAGIVGVLVFVHPDSARFDERTERLASGIALQAAAAVDNARLYQAAQREIAERMRTEALLRSSEERFRLATQTGRVGIWDFDIATRRIVWSESLYAIHGIAADAFDGTLDGFERLVHPEDRDRVRQAMAATFERDAKYELEFRALRPDGETIWLFSEAGLVRDETGRPSRLLGATMDVTARRRAENALRESEERFRFMADNAPVMIWVTDADGRGVFLSRSWYDFTGMTPERALGDGWEATLHPEEREQLVAGFRFHNQRREAYEIEHRVRRADGEYRWCMSRAAPRFAADGRYLGYVGSMIDMTERRRAESAVRISEARYRQLVQGLPAAVLVCDGDGRIVLFNDEAVALWGHRPMLGEDMAGAEYRMYDENGSLLSSEERPLALALKGHSGLLGKEVVIERTDGERRNVIVYPQVIRNDSGGIVGGIKVMVDITERKVAEAELAATKDHLAEQVAALTRLHDLATRLAGVQALEPALDAVLQTLVAITRSDFGLLSLYEPENNRLRTASQIGFSQEDLDRVECIEPGMGACAQALTTRQRVIVENAHEAPEFAQLHDFAEKAGFRAIHSTPILNRNGDALGVLSVYSRRSRRPSPLEIQFADMCARYAAETIELILSQQSLREADRRKDEFLATLAHELRNPLAPIRNAMHVIKMAGDDRQAIAETRGIIERQLQQMVRLVDDLLDVSRISRGKIELRRENVDLARVVRSAIETSDALVKQHGHALTVALPDEPVMIFADETRLAQVFSNLLNNAAKYTPPGGHIELSVRRRAGAVRVAVRDDGIGIPPSHLPTVFEMFTQVESSLERSGGGLGVGLTIVKRLVEMHGGSIEAHSEGRGKGSEFVVTLPLSSADDKPSPAIAAKGPAAPAGPRRILVVDDNVDLATTLSRMLTMMGNEVETVHNGAAAIEATERFLPEIVFLDIGMPKMNGYEACRRIRERRAGRDVIIVALSGWGQEHDKQRSMQAGMDLHLVKPIDPAALESLLAGMPVRVDRKAEAAARVPLDKGVNAESSVAIEEPAERGPVVSLSERLRAGDERAPVEAIRFGLFRRVAPALRHDLVGELQGIRFAVDLAQRQLRQWTDEPAMGESLGRVASQTQEAVRSGDAILEWLRPDPSTVSTVAATIDQCLAMLRTDWSMRGIEVRTSLPAGDRQVQGQGFREVFAASLFALSDALRTPADVEVAAADDGPMVELRLSARVAARDAFPPTPVPRTFGWDEVQALARANGVEWSRQDLKISMRFPGLTALAA